MQSYHTIFAAFIAPVVLFHSTAQAQCPPIDFENFAPGTFITSQYPGVTFSVLPNSCGGSVDLFLDTPVGGTRSGSLALVIEGGCPDFSPDYIRMDFDEPQSLVEFFVGEPFGIAGVEFQIRAFHSGGWLARSTFSVIAGEGVRTFVRVGSEGSIANISRIEVQSPISFFEAIDDLRFGADTTPPVAEINSPNYGACVCNSVNILGSANDPDGDYGQDMLHYRRINADPSEPWTLVGSFPGSPVTDGFLYSWNTTSIPHGRYYLRLTVENACGLQSSDVTTVLVDRAAPSINVVSPTAGALVCGTVEFEGSVTDGGCMDYWILEYAMAGTGSWTAINSGSGNEYCNLGEWDTLNGPAGQIPDGLYDIRVRSADICGNYAETNFQVTIDNTSGSCDNPADINGDGIVNIADLLFLLGAWG